MHGVPFGPGTCHERLVENNNSSKSSTSMMQENDDDLPQSASEVSKALREALARADISDLEFFFNATGFATYKSCGHLTQMNKPICYPGQCSFGKAWVMLAVC